MMWMWMMHRLRSLTIFAALLASTLGAEPVSEDHGKDSSPGIKFEDACFYSVPSLSCAKKCEKLGKLPYCPDKGKSCLCRDEDTRVEPTKAESNLPSSELNEPVYANGKVVKMEDYCLFGQVPSLLCRAKCNKNDLEPYCGIASHSCLCKQPGAMTPTPPPQDNYCWFGEFPSFACYKRCGQRGAVCVRDSLTNECRCKEEEEETQITTPDVDTGTLETPGTQDAETQTDSPMHHLFIYIKFGGGLFGSNGGESEKEEEESDDEWEDDEDGDDDEEDRDQDHSNDGLEVIGSRSTAAPDVKLASDVKLAHTRLVESHNGISREQLSTLQTLAASGIILILLALLAIELYSLYARKRSEKGLAHVFNTFPTTKT